MRTDQPDRSRRPSPTTRARFSRALSVLYFARTGVSLAWVLIVTTSAGGIGPTSSPGPFIWALLVLYPVIDAAATLIDIRTTPRESQTTFLRLNLATSLAAAGAIAATVNGDFATTIDVFGAWAIASGAIQLIVALRRNTLISAQWFMVISGVGSIFAGTTFLRWQGNAHAGIATLVQYSTGGAVWYGVAATWLLASSHRHRGQALDISSLPSAVDRGEADASNLAPAERP